MRAANRKKSGTMALFALLVMVMEAGETASASAAGGGAEEAAMLMRVKEGIDPGGEVLRNWYIPGGEFEGVTWDSEGYVVSISVSGAGLAGVIPVSISDLPRLSTLRLHSNLLHGPIPPLLFKLSSLSHLLLHSNRLSGSIPPELGLLYRLQELQLSRNDLQGSIPVELGALPELKVLSLHHNKLLGEIPSSLGYVNSLVRVDLSFNRLNGSIPPEMARLTDLKLLDVTNNSLSGPVPSGLTRLRQGFAYDNNSLLCGAGFGGIRQCGRSETVPNSVEMEGTGADQPMAGARPMSSIAAANRTSISRADSSAAPLLHVQAGGTQTATIAQHAAVIAGVAAIAVGTIAVVALVFILFRRHKQKISSTFEMADPSRFSHPFSSELKLFHSGDGGIARPSAMTATPPLRHLHNSAATSSSSTAAAAMAAMQHRASRSFGSFTGVVFLNGSHQIYQYDLEELEMATNFFSDKNLLGKKSSHSVVYRGMLRDGSSVAIRTLHKASCSKAAGMAEFKAAVATIAELRHENLVTLKGFCYSTAMVDCYLVYDFVANGTLQEHLGRKKAVVGKAAAAPKCLDWASRARIAGSIARAMEYMHQGTETVVVHQNISSANILLDDNCNAYVSDAGLYRLLADDIVYAVMKASAAGGYLAPEYVATGRLTEKSDVYAAGVVLLELLTGREAAEGRRKGADGQNPAEEGGMVSWARAMIGGGCIEDIVDPMLQGRFSPASAAHMAAVAFGCTHDDPSQRPDAADVVKLLRIMDSCAASAAAAAEEEAAACCLSSGEDYPRRQQALFAERLLADNGR